MRTRGRPTLLTPAVADELVSVLAAGGTVRDAAAATGVSARTIWEWRQRAWSRDPLDARYVALERRLVGAVARAGPAAEPELEDVRQIVARFDDPLDWSPFDE
jgi:hypothetical protein